MRACRRPLPGQLRPPLRRTSFLRWFGNSVFVALARTIIAITLSLMAGYAFAKFEFRFKRPLFISW